MDPYCLIHLDKKKDRRTETLKDAGKNPKWKETFNLKISDINEQITFKVYDKDVISDDHVGDCKIRIRDMLGLTLTKDPTITNE
jgi:Ca2+-dependent lipid-binding protein